MRGFERRRNVSVSRSRYGQGSPSSPEFWDPQALEDDARQADPEPRGVHTTDDAVQDLMAHERRGRRLMKAAGRRRK